MKKKAFFLYFFLSFNAVLSFNLNADFYSGSSEAESLILHAPVWVFLEPQPGTITDAERGRFIPPRKALKELSRFLLAGMTYGWKFTYIPIDKKREIKEFFEIVPVYSIPEDDERLLLKEVKAQYPYFYCRAEYCISAAEKARIESWKSVNYKTVKGRGEAERKLELDGVYEAYSQAAKNAVREFGRKIEKNKPKQIKGELLIKKNPRLFAESGKFCAELEMYINVTEIIKYTTF